MKLSAEQFAELAASFEQKQTPTPNDRRRATRLELSAGIKIRPVHNEYKLDPMFVIVRDFNARGLSFMHTTMMEAGRQFITELPRKSGGFISLLCTVVHCETLGHNAWRIGAEFTCVIPAGGAGAADSDEMRRISDSVLR